MRLHRFYIIEKVSIDEKLIVTDERVVHQVRNVFRLGKGDSVILFCGDGFDYVSEIESSEKNSLVFIPKEKKNIPKTSKEVHVYLACIRKERFEWAVEKLTELGVATITPVETERSEHTHLNIERLRKIAIEASEQCGRGNVPDISAVKSLELTVNSINEGEILVADFGGEKISKVLTPNFLSINYLVGPEGGWSESERELFMSKKINTVSLGETVLRAETAAIVGCAILTLQDSQRN